MNYQAARYNMIEQQIRPWDVLDQKVLDVLTAVPREQFVPAQYQSLSFADTRLPIGHSRKTLNPNLEGRILQSLSLSENDRVLEIGTGTGYLTACFASLCRHVDSSEPNKTLASDADNRLKSLGFSNYKIEVADFATICGKSEQYDAVIILGSIDTLSPACREKLSIGGRMLCFIGAANSPVHAATLLTRVSDSEFSENVLFETWIDPIDML